MTASFAYDVQTNLMRKVMRNGRPPRPAQAPDFEEGKEDYIDYMNMYDETITTEPLDAPLSIQKKRPVVNMNRLKERMKKQASYSMQNGAQVIPMTIKQMFARYKLELPVEVPLGSAGSRRTVSKTQATRHNIRRKLPLKVILLQM